MKNQQNKTQQCRCKEQCEPLKQQAIEHYLDQQRQKLIKRGDYSGLN